MTFHHSWPLAARAECTASNCRAEDQGFAPQGEVRHANEQRSDAARPVAFAKVAQLGYDRAKKGAEAPRSGRKPDEHCRSQPAQRAVRRTRRDARKPERPLRRALFRWPG